MIEFDRKTCKELEKKIGYSFKKRALLKRALTHKSFRFEDKDTDHDNQRLEFLGDAVLGYAAASCLYESRPEDDEGVLTTLRSQTTSGKALSEIAVEIDLGKYLLMGKGERKSGGQQRPSNLADAVEAIMGAAYLDGGMKGFNKVFKKLVHPRIQALSGDIWVDNPKGKLQEHSQKTWKESPLYEVIEKKGPPHATVFNVKVSLPDGSTADGQGCSKQDAEADAASKVLSRISE